MAGKRLAGSVLLIAAGVVEVLVILPLGMLAQSWREVLVDLRVGRVLEGVVLEHGRGGAHAVSLTQLTYVTSGRRAPGATVVGALAHAGQHHRGIGKHQLVFAALGVLKLMEIETALFGG